MKRFYKIFVFVLFVFYTSLLAQPNQYVILVSFDGFRWDYQNRGITPNLDEVINEGVTALSLRPCFPSKTFPNHISIATGMFPENHGIISNDFTNPFTNEEYKMSDTVITRQSKWYNGEFIWETLERNNIRTASYFWPGSELTLKERKPSFNKQYQHKFPYKNRVDSVISWLQLPENIRPHFITLYFDATDTYGHKYGPNSAGVNFAIKQLDSIAGYLINRINEIGLTDKTNIIFLSDHGMTDISNERIINIQELLKDYKAEFFNDGPVMTIKTEPKDRDKVYNLLCGQKHFTTYKKENLPDYFRYNKNPFISDLILVADLGWTLANNGSINKIKKYGGLGNHGFSKDELDMHGFFVAKGPSFKNNFKTGTIWNIDIYPLICKIFSVSPRSNIDGNLERIQFLLK
ncbi:MAG: ectonucleotide pyrophosphatase/phosphodiesterase [bacterium]